MADRVCLVSIKLEPVTDLNGRGSWDWDLGYGGVYVRGWAPTRAAALRCALAEALKLEAAMREPPRAAGVAQA